MKYYKISEWIYLIISIISLIETISLWNIDREKSYFFMVFAGLCGDYMNFHIFRRQWISARDGTVPLGHLAMPKVFAPK